MVSSSAVARLEAPSTAEFRTALRERKAELLELLAAESSEGWSQTLRVGVDGTADELWDRLFTDDSVPWAVFHPRMLDRDFVVVRNQAALARLTEEQKRMPLLYLSEAIGSLPREALRALLVARRVFDQEEVVFRGVRPPEPPPF